MASLRQLRLPSVAESEDKLGWDETIGSSSSNEILHSRPTWARPSLCSHAIAHENLVCGIGTNDNEDWTTTWKTSFAPQRVCRVVSNLDGSIVVASTNGGSVSLLSGKDGKVLATRNVMSSSTSKGNSSHAAAIGRRPAEVSFVSRSEHCHETKDVLTILVPTSDPLQMTNEEPSDADAQTLEDTVNVIIVSNIDGKRLNDDGHPEQVVEAAKAMSIDVLKLDTAGVDCNDVESIQGCFLNNNATTIRFAVGDVDGNVSIHDYNLETKRSNVLCKKIETERIEEQQQQQQQPTFVTTLGMRLQHGTSGATFLLLCGIEDSTTKACCTAKLYWYDLVHLNMACAYTLPAPPFHSQQPRLLALEPVTSFSNEFALAAAVALKESSTSQSGCVQVIQVHVEETMGLAVLSHPHKVYQIPLIGPNDSKHPLEGIALSAALDRRVEPYSFRFEACFGADHVECHELITSDTATVVGKIRMLLERERYDEADALLAANKHCQVLISSDPFAMFHTSEVALRKLQRLLSREDLGSDENMERAEECLRRIVAGAVSGNEIGQQHLLDATKSVIDWPKFATSDQKPTVGVFSVAISAMIAAIETCLSAYPSNASELEGKKQELVDRLSAMKCIEVLVETDASEIVLDTLFLDSKSPCDVFLILMEKGYYSVAEKLWRSEWGNQLTAEASATAILSLLPSQDPRAYASVLQHFIFPKLSISHEAIPLIRAWACRCANAFDDDDNELGLDASIFLLETVLAGIRQLNAQMHSSYATYSPFVEMKPKKHRVSPRNSQLDTTLSSFSSEVSTSSQPRRSNVSSSALSFSPTPTVLELGYLKGGAMKSKLGSVPGGRSGNAVSFTDDEVDDGEESVDIKLAQANLLRKARELGLPHEVMSLRDYLKLGGNERVAKELVRIHSSSAPGHEERYRMLTSKVKPFCDEAGVDYDQTLVAFNADLCDSKRTSAVALLESSSIARCCFAPLVKCQVALAVLRVALICGKAPSCLTQLSRDAIEWAMIDMDVRSQLEEATRLLVVDNIVRKYCGAGSREIFRVDNPVHVTRLMDFVSRHFRTKSVLCDVFDLCDAFTFLVREEACVLVLERAIASGDEDLCVELLNTAFSLCDTTSVDAVSRRVLKYCCHELEDACSMVKRAAVEFQRDSFKRKAVAMCRVGRAIVEACRDHFHEKEERLPLLQASFVALLRLQKHHELFLPVSIFGWNEEILNASRCLMKPVLDAFLSGDEEAGASLMMRVKATCTVLAGPSGLDVQSLWCAVAGEAASYLAGITHDGECIDFLAAAGVLDDFAYDYAVRAMLSVALSLFRRASNDAHDIGNDNATLHRMEDIIRASALVHDYSLIGCPERILEVLVSLGLLTETARQVALRADEGMGEAVEILCEQLTEDARVRRHRMGTRACPLKRTGFDTLRVRKRLLHPSWYVGDGLLLSPRDALARSVACCADVMDVCQKTGSSEYDTNGIVEIHRFLGDRGAHSTALRMSSVYASIALSADRLPNSFYDTALENGFLNRQRDSLSSLAERSLGGGGSGITSMTIDSQLAVSFLLSLPLKAAFKFYRASLPTAITKRDFSRVITLANIGVKTSDADIGWKQPVFLSQCLRLASHARWWSILKCYQVEFDPSRFDEDQPLPEEEGAAGTSSSDYVASLVPELISKASLVHRSTDSVRAIATDFVKAFDLDPIISAQKHIEYMLSPPPVDLSCDSRFSPESACAEAEHVRGYPDMRLNVALCDRAARESLRLVSSPMKRFAVLRKCLTDLESANECNKDYERHAMLLSLCHTCLSLVVASDLNIRDLDASAFEEELEFIERRRDALAILSSYFQGQQKVHRPPFPKFFAPLSVPFNMKRDSSVDRPCDYLGLAVERNRGTFDPLAPLQEFVALHMDEAAAKALAPLTIPLGLPDGSIHARWLIERFRKSSDGRDTLPSFENDVLPVLKRLKQATEQSRLAEWCAAKYHDLDSQKLQCLDCGLRFAMAASSDVEKRIRLKSRNDDDDLAADERLALDTVKRLSEMHSVLSDRLEVNRVLRSGIIGTSQFSSVEKTVRDLMDRLQETFWKSSDSSPEKFVEILLVEASLLASTACLEQDTSFSISQFRSMASAVHQACKKIADQYSHVHPGDISRYLARRWLVHGIDLSAGSSGSGKAQMSDEMKASRIARELSTSIVANEEDTVDFVMDLNDTKSVWSDDIGSASQKGEEPTKISREEEPWALQVDGSPREASELECTAVSLRVAFVMSFAEGYHRNQSGETSDEENLGSRLNSKHQRDEKKKRPGLLSRISTKDSGTRGSVPVLEHARELLRIAFAKSGRPGTDLTSSFVSANASSSDDKTQESRTTMTFAMRYRALRTAAVLCPQAALEQIVAEEGYWNGGVDSSPCSLSKCSYGAFVAKEIEEMGLPLPHSDLLVLSTMNFPSYARALWRHHRDGEIKGQKGRLLLLLLEMSLRDNSVGDLSIVVLNEMTKLQLPRTLLLGCECIARSKENAIGSHSAFLSQDETAAVSNAVFTTANLVLSELHRTLSSKDSKDKHLARSLPTIRRAGTLVESFGDSDIGQRQLFQFVKVLSDLVVLCDSSFSNYLVEIALSASRRIRNIQSRKEAFAMLHQEDVHRRLTGVAKKQTGSPCGKSSSLSTLLLEAEASYHPSVVLWKE